jgi:hypothetical protein
MTIAWWRRPHGFLRTKILSTGTLLEMFDAYLFAVRDISSPADAPKVNNFHVRDFLLVHARLAC